MKKNRLLLGVIVVLALVVGILGFEVVKLKREVAGVTDAAWISPFSMPQVRDRLSVAFPKWEQEPFYELSRIQDEMNKLFNDSLWRGLGRRKCGFFTRADIFNPEIDIKETSTQYIVKADLPGLEKDQINIEVKDHILTISGEKEKEFEESKGHRFFRKERNFGSFTRMVRLPEDAQTDTIHADYKKGVLTITIPKIALGKGKISSNKIIVQ